MDEIPCGSKDNLTATNSEIDELQFLKDITVRTELQEVLEEQALHELTVFNSKTSADKEDGEISDAEKVVDNEETVVAEKKGNLVSLDINSYIKRQEELRKRQQHVRSLEITEKSREIARKISKKQKSVAKSEVKRKDTNTNTHTENTNDIVCESLNKVAKKRKGSDSDYVPSNEELSDVDYEPEHSTTQIAEIETSRKRKRVENVINTPKIVDDGSIQCYKARLANYYEKIEEEQKLLGLNNEDADHVIEIYENLKINKKIWENLYCYQQEGIEWLYELHLKSVGGILGDEMGLGKTVQIIAFLNALDCSKHIPKNKYKGLGPTVIICPATVIHQWVQHFHEWAPEFRVAILHQSGSFTGNKTALIRDINKNNGILITTYLGVLKYKGLLTELNWHYVILDEGHKIRNPNTQVSIAIKEFRTPHRIMLTGSPMQNNLQELWSLFDFTNPGMLGTVTVFMEHFANPIMQGGYANATQMQESMALSMATALKNLITPHLLRRSKQEVREAISLPNKSEQVLFCSLSDEQRDLYKGYLMGEHISRILGRGGKNWFNENSTRANVLVAITTLRIICNHPDLYMEADLCFGETEGEESIGFYKKSGKMVVISALLKIWKRQKHRVLLFTQSRGMILIFEEFLKQQGYNYLKMDGGTSIKSRQPLIDKFNKDISYDVFLLTTRVGGLGVNLTGANRVVIYDPDWNPATDTQARERAWRIGQEKNVTVYRLISAGTIEEKIYQRQVWKQLLSNKVLLDPKTQRFFKTSDLHDLFSFQEQTEQCGTETGNIFKNSRVSMEKHLKQKKKEKQSKPSKSIQFSDDKIQRMKDLAAQISKTLNTDPKPTKSLDQIDFEQQRLQRKEEKEELKKMSAPELHTYNREKAKETHEEISNKVDEIKTNISFSNALEFSEKTAQLYNEVKTQFDKTKVENATHEYTTLTTTIIDTSNNCSNNTGVSDIDKSGEYLEETLRKRKKHHKKNKRKSESDDFQGEQINGLVKTEMKQIKQQKETNKNETQDQYVLEKLFSKKNVHTALQHDVIVQSGGNGETSSLRIHSETRNRTDLALQALRNSRINTLRW